MTVGTTLNHSVPPVRKPPPPGGSVRKPVKGFIDGMPRQDTRAPREYRRTLRRILQRLAAERDFEQASHTPAIRDFRAQAPTWREEREATAAATDSPFNEWEAIFNEPRCCVAIADRIPFRRTLIHTGAESCRLRATEAEQHTAR